jgi:6-pyruvoyltetrahydropterin/6-carboxytetrahydropterin synthase
MFITKEISWDMGHRVPNHKSKCRNPHGHRYKAFITLKGNIIQEKGVSDEGMVIDFSDVRAIANGFIDETLDHGFMVYEKDHPMRRGFKNMEEMLPQGEAMKIIVVPFIPTAENIARWLFEQLETKFIDTYNTQLTLYKITLWETPTSFVEYQPN